VEASIVEVNRLIARTYDELRVPAGDRLRKLSRSDLCNSSAEYPVLKHVKGRRVRKFSAAAARIAALYSDDTRGQHRLRLCQALDSWYDLTDLPDLIWPAEVSKAAAAHVDSALAHYSWLARDALRHGKFRYSIVQKHHLWAHMSRQSEFLAPRACWCYGPESFMGMVTQIAAACVRGTAGHKVPAKVLAKFSLSYDLLLKGHLSWEDADYGP
jgi:hypothetical protein